MKKLLALFAVLIVVVAVFSRKPDGHAVPSANIVPSENPVVAVEPKVEQRKSPQIVRVGDDCRLHSGEEQIILGVSNDINSRITKLLIAKDSIGILNLVNAKLAFIVQSGTKARIIDKGFLTSEVRILEGNHFGRSGFLPSEFLVAIDAVKEEQEQQQLERLNQIEAAEKKQLEEQKQQEQMNLEIARRKEANEALRKAAQEAREREKMLEKERLDKKAAEDEDKANELLKHAKRWLNEGNKELAVIRLKDLLKRFPESKAAPEGRQLLEKIEGK